MGGVESTRKDFFAALRNLDDVGAMERAKKALAETEEKLTIGNIIEKETQMNALMVLVSRLKAAELHFIKEHIREFDIKYINPLNGYSVLHYLGDLSPGDYVPINPRSADTDTQKYHVALGDLAELLLMEGADINARDNFGRTPLMLAASSQQALVVRELCGGGAEVNFLTALGDSPLLSAISGGSVDCVSQILALCKSEVKMNSYYDNYSGATYTDSSPSPSTKAERQMAQRPLALALTSQRKNVFEFLIRNNFELTQWYNLKLFLPESKLSPADADKFFKNTPLYSGGQMYLLKNAAPTEEDIGNSFDGRELFVLCAGNSLAQAALLRSFGAFEILVEQYDPRLPFAKFPKNASILHVVASFKVETKEQSDSAIDFVDAIRDKCTKYSSDGKYNWNIRDSEGETPFDYCVLANERPLLIGPHSEKPRMLAAVSKPFTALIFIETFKHYPADGEEIEISIGEGGDAEVPQVLALSPPALANKITRISMQRCNYPDVLVSKFVESFPNLEELILDDLDDLKDVLGRILGRYGEKKARQAKKEQDNVLPKADGKAKHEKEEAESDANEIHPNDYLPTKLKKIVIINCKKIQQGKAKAYAREGLEIVWEK